MARQSTCKKSNRGTRKVLTGGVPMFLRKLTQRVGNSAPWGQVQKFTRTYKDGVKTIGDNPTTYKYFILSLSENTPIQTKLDNIELEQENIDMDNTTEYFNKFDGNIQKLFNSGKLAFVVNNLNTDNIPYYIIHKTISNREAQVTPVSKFNVANIDGINSIRIFIYKPSNKPRIALNLPKRQEYGKYPTTKQTPEKKAYNSANSQGYILYPNNPKPYKPDHKNSGQPNNYTNPNIFDIPTFGFNNSNSISTDSINTQQLSDKQLKLLTEIQKLYDPLHNKPGYLARPNQGNIVDKYLNPIEFISAINILKQYPVGSVAIYTRRKRNNETYSYTIIYVIRHPTNETKLVIRAIDISWPKLHSNLLHSLPTQIKYVIGNGPYNYERTFGQIANNINKREAELAKTKALINKILADCSNILNKTEILRKLTANYELTLLTRESLPGTPIEAIFPDSIVIDEPTRNIAVAFIKELLAYLTRNYHGKFGIFIKHIDNNYQIIYNIKDADTGMYNPTMKATGAAKLYANIYNAGTWKTELQNLIGIIGMTKKTVREEYASPQNAVNS